MNLVFVACKQSKVTERKHRDVKRAALHVFRHLEQTTLASILNMQCEQVLDGHSMFQKEFLVAPSTMVLFDVKISRSSNVVLECGSISASDLVYLHGGAVVRAQSFFALHECLAMQCIVCNRISENIYRDGDDVSFVSCSDILDSMAYRMLSDGSFRVIKPIQARFE